MTSLLLTASKPRPNGVPLPLVREIEIGLRNLQMPPALFSFQGGGFLLSKATKATIDKHDLALHLTFIIAYTPYENSVRAYFSIHSLLSSQIAPSLKQASVSLSPLKKFTETQIKIRFSIIDVRSYGNVVPTT